MDIPFSEKTLLILGAGGHGEVVAETAQASGFSKIAFLDDNSPKAIGAIRDLADFRDRFSYAFVSIGNPVLREALLSRLEEAGYQIPVLVSPAAYVSPSAKLGKGSIAEPGAIVSSNASVGIGCILSVGAIIDHNAVIEDFCHVNAGAIVKAGGKLPRSTKLDAGQVAAGYGETTK